MSWRTRLGAHTATVAVFVLLTVMATAALAYEAWGSTRAQRASAEQALREYARFAALGYRQRLLARLYTVIVPIIRPVADPRVADSGGPLPEVERLRALAEDAVACRCGPAVEPTTYFRVLYESREVTTAGSTPTPKELALFASLPDSIDEQRAASTTWEYATIYDVSSAAPRIVVIALRRGPNRAPRAIYGFVVPASSFHEAMFRNGMLAQSLLPQTPAESVPNDTLLSVVLSDSTRGRYVASGVAYDPLYAASVPFVGVAGISSIEVSLNPRRAPDLLIGGLPPSRLPVLLALLGLCVVLLATTLIVAARAATLARLRSEFVANVSHDLRTPLAQILLFGETLSLGRMSTRREVSRAADIIVGETRRLMQLVDNVLLFGRGQRGPVRSKAEPIAMAALVHDVVTAFAPLAATGDAKVNVVRQDECTVAGNRSEIVQALLNLLDNAVKYGPRGQTISVGLESVGGSDGSFARLWVEDEGGGIPERERDRVWKPFVRLDRDIDGETAGSGIGLAVVKDVVDRHRGRCRIDAASAGGARVVLEIPFAELAITERTPREYAENA